MLRRFIVTGMAVCILAMLLVSHTFSAAGAGGGGRGGTGAGGRAGRGQRAPREGARQTQRDPVQMQRMMKQLTGDGKRGRGGARSLLSMLDGLGR